MIITEKKQGVLTIRKVVKSRNIDKVIGTFQLSDSELNLDNNYNEELKKQTRSVFADILGSKFWHYDNRFDSIQILVNFCANTNKDISTFKVEEETLTAIFNICSQLDTSELLNFLVEKEAEVFAPRQWSGGIVRSYRSYLCAKKMDIDDNFLQTCYTYHRMNMRASGNTTESFVQFKTRAVDNDEFMRLTKTEKEWYLRVMYFQGYENFRNYAIYDFIRTCRKMNTKLPTGNFAINYRTIMNEYYDKQDSLELETFLASQSKIQLDTEKAHTEKFSVVIPKSREELKAYGSQLHNCLNSYEWNSHLANGERQVVVIIDTNTKQAVAAIDFSVDKKVVFQFLAYCNTTPDDIVRKYFDEYIKDHLF